MKLTAEQVAAELERLRVPYLIDMERADAECDTEDYEYNEHFAELLTKAIWLVRNNLIESPDERRARFEKWYRLQCHPSQKARCELQLEREAPGNNYSGGPAAIAWKAFNASRDFRGDAWASD